MGEYPAMWKTTLLSMLSLNYFEWISSNVKDYFVQLKAWLICYVLSTLSLTDVCMANRPSKYCPKPKALIGVGFE